MDELIKRLLPFVPSTLPFLLLLYFFLNPEKFDKWQAIIWGWLSGFGRMFKGAHKKYIKHDLQGRVNDFTKRLGKTTPFLANNKVKVELVEGDVNRRSFLQNDQVFLRLRRDDPEELNFVHGAYMAVSTGLLHRVKRHISPSQKEAVDLYVTTKLLEQEKQSVVGLFVDNYLYPKTEGGNPKISELLDRFGIIDRSGLFYAVFLEELDFLGHKVFGKRRDQRVIAEVDALTSFLENMATRKIGEEGEMDFQGQNLSCAIGIVGKSWNLSPTGEVYVNYIRSQLVPRQAETIYLVGRWENKKVLNNIANEVSDIFENVRTRRQKVTVRYGDTERPLEQYMIVLRKRGISVLRPSA